MRKIFLSAGHGGNDPGAVSGTFIERDLAIEFRDLIARELMNLGIIPMMDSNQNALAQTLAWLRGKFGSKDILFDIHWNAAASTQANGTEVILPNVHSAFEKGLAASILQVFIDNGFKSRGVKTEAQTARKTLGWMRPNAENVLLETCFITNTLDMKLYQATKYGIAKRIAKVLADFAKL